MALTTLGTLASLSRSAAARLSSGAGSKANARPTWPRLLDSIAFNLDQQNPLAEGEAFYRQAVEQQAKDAGADSVATADAESLLRRAPAARRTLSGGRGPVERR